MAGILMNLIIYHEILPKDSLVYMGYVLPSSHLLGCIDWRTGYENNLLQEETDLAVMDLLGHFEKE